MKIYIVMGSGEQEDSRREWLVKAFAQQSSAEIHKDICDAYSEKLSLRFEGVDQYSAKWHEIYEKIIRDLSNYPPAHDPHLSYFYIDRGLIYAIEEVEYSTD